MFPGLELKNITKSFGVARVLRSVSLNVSKGEIVALLGPSGCGKTTLLHIIAGLENPDEGKLDWVGENLLPVPSHQRGFGLMFQNYALFPHMNVFDNIAFGLKMQKLSRDEIKRRVAEMLHLIDLPEFDFRDINTLSGGEQQRVALGRALAPKPRLLMLDEPLGALDRTLRERLLVDLRKALKQLEQTAIYVTHDQEEAFAVADRVVVMNAGKVVQIGTPREIYQDPYNLFVAQFLGMSNRFEGILRQSPEGWLIDTLIGNFAIANLKQSISPEILKERPVIVLLRPDAVYPTQAYKRNHLQGVLLEKSFRGNRSRFVIAIDELQLSFEVPAQTQLPPIGDILKLGFDPKEAIHFFLMD